MNNMTRINCVDPLVLEDSFLLAEHREIKRIPNQLLSKGYNPSLYSKPKEYVLGKGHVTFFFDKLIYLYQRYQNLHYECLHRGFAVSWLWPEDWIFLDYNLKNNWTPSSKDQETNIERLISNIDKKEKVRYRRENIDREKMKFITKYII